MHNKSKTISAVSSKKSNRANAMPVRLPEKPDLFALQRLPLDIAATPSPTETLLLASTPAPTTKLQEVPPKVSWVIPIIAPPRNYSPHHIYTMIGGYIGYLATKLGWVGGWGGGGGGYNGKDPNSSTIIQPLRTQFYRFIGCSRRSLKFY